MSLATTAALFFLGGVLSVRHGMLDVFLASRFVYVFHVDLLLALFSILWLDRRGLETIVEMRSAFALSDADYYRFTGQMVERIYEPLPHAPRPDRRWLHRPVAVAYLAGVLVFVAGPVTLYPAQLASLLGVPWSTLPLSLQGYFV